MRRNAQKGNGVFHIGEFISIYDVAVATEQAFLDVMVKDKILPSEVISFEVFDAVYNAGESTQD